MLLVLDIQHIGKPHNPTDRGVYWPLESRGVHKPSPPHHYEAAKVLQYVAAATESAAVDGTPTVVLCQGRYPDRHRKVGELARIHGAPILYVACHLNIMPGEPRHTFGLVAHDARSRDGAAAAAVLASHLRTETDNPDVRVRSIGPSAPEVWQRNVFSTYAGIWRAPARVVGVCYEPAHINDTTRTSAEGLAKIGHALAVGAAEWLQSF
jgi:hypothetical protein